VARLHHAQAFGAATRTGGRGDEAGEAPVDAGEVERRTMRNDGSLLKGEDKPA